VILSATRAARPLALVLALLTSVIARGCSPAPRAPAYDLLLTGGRIVDGTGREPFAADVAVAGGRIAALGRLDPSRAARLIDVSGLIVSPGFIDIHTHCDADIADFPLAENSLRQGVTTVIGGNCGTHPYPMREAFRSALAGGFAPNWGLLAGHNTIRTIVMGYRAGPPSGDEMRRMKALVEEEMASGALGFSTGLSYLPGVFSDTDEVAELAAVAGRRGGFYATHLRDQGPGIKAALEEALRVGERGRMRVEISHIKLADERVWGRLDLITGPLEDARRRGLEVSLDLYPYTAVSTTLTSSFPAWSFEGGPELFVERLEDPALRARIKASVLEARFRSARGRNLLRTTIISDCPSHPDYNGRNVEEILRGRKTVPTPSAAADLLIDIQASGGAGAVFFQMNEPDVEALLRRPDVMVASDGGLTGANSGQPHPRNFGTFPRVIGLYVKDKGLLSLGEAVRKMTSLPARVLGLRDRGLVQPGQWADLTVFDPERFRDAATYAEPRQFPPGLVYVFVNGQAVVSGGRTTGAKPGRVLYGPGRRGTDT
jgi:N-acyl-D-amino-acid deacylase